MKKVVQKVLISAAILTVAGVAVTGVGAIVLRANSKTTKKEQTVEQNFHSVVVDAELSDVQILPAANGKCSVRYAQDKHTEYTITVSEGVLRIAEEDTSKWHEKIGNYFWDKVMYIYLPKDSYTALSVTGEGGDIEIVDSQSTFTNITIKTNSGDVDFMGVTVGNVLSVNSTSGDIELMNVTSQTFTATATSGDIECELLRVVGQTELTTRSGDVGLENCDSGTYKIRTNSGDVHGRLLSAKDFSRVSTDSGRKRVPNSTTGGVCEIITSSGDILVDIVG